MSKIVALFVADLHLSWNPPVARSAEESWLDAQARPLRQLRDLQEKYDCPVVCAGDIFDKYNPTPALINWATRHLPVLVAIPGQHELPLHNLEDLEKSAYRTLIDTKIICWHVNDVFSLHSFPFGVQITPLEKELRGLRVAVAHSYIWTEGNQYTGAPNGDNLSSYIKQLKGYGVAVFGDNHKGFTAKAGDCTVYNCGCLIRRKQNEREYKPAVGLLFDNGKVKRHFLDVSEDKWLEDDEELPLGEVNERELSEFIDGLGGLDVERVGFGDMVRRYVNDGEVSDGVGKVMLEALEGK